MTSAHNPRKFSADMPQTNLPELPKETSVNPFKKDEDRQKFILSLYSKWKHFEYNNWPTSLTLKPFDLDYFPNSPIFAVYLTDDLKEHWIRFYLVNEKEFLIIDMFGDLRKFPADWFPTAEITPDEVSDWLKRRYEHDR